MSVFDKTQSITGLTIAYVGECVLAYLDANGPTPLSQLRLFAATLSRDDAAISSAFGILQSAKRIHLDAERVMHPAHPTGEASA